MILAAFSGCSYKIFPVEGSGDISQRLADQTIDAYVQGNYNNCEELYQQFFEIFSAEAEEIEVSNQPGISSAYRFLLTGGETEVNLGIEACGNSEVCSDSRVYTIFNAPESGGSTLGVVRGYFRYNCGLPLDGNPAAEPTLSAQTAHAYVAVNSVQQHPPVCQEFRLQFGEQFLSVLGYEEISLSDLDSLSLDLTADNVVGSEALIPHESGEVYYLVILQSENDRHIPGTFLGNLATLCDYNP